MRKWPCLILRWAHFPLVSKSITIHNNKKVTDVADRRSFPPRSMLSGLCLLSASAQGHRVNWFNSGGSWNVGFIKRGKPVREGSGPPSSRFLPFNNCTSVQTQTDLTGNDCCGGTQTLNSTEQCCAACHAKATAGCRFWTYDAALRHCYLKSSDAGRRKRSGHVSASAQPSPAPPNTSCPRVPEPPATPHPPLPAGNFRFPYNNSFIIKDAGDGCPDVDIDRFDNGAELCPAVWRDECTAKKGSDEDIKACECGTPRAGGKHEKGCYQCTGQPHHLQRKPCNVTAWKSKDMCGRYPPMTRKQIIERALGWVSNGFVYGTFAAPGGTPETCGSEDGPACPQYSYEAVCNGLLEMAWKSDDTNKGADGKKKTWPPTKIDCMSVMPGDWIHIGAHQQMFRRWVNGSGWGKEFVLYQMGGGWGKANAVVSSFTHKYGPCYRRPNIIGNDYEHDGKM